MKTTGPVPGPRHAALIQLLRTADTLWHASRALFAGWGLSPSQFNVLNLLHLAGSGLTQTELSRELLMHRSNLTGLVDQLEARGLVARRDRPGDRRAYRIMLKPAGDRLVREILPVYYRAAEEVWGGLSARAAERWVAELAAMCANAQRMSATLSQAQRPAAA
jgi:DNA-binding MarR family transcriptional regulator